MSTTGSTAGTVSTDAGSPANAGTLYHVYRHRDGDGLLEPVDANVRAASDKAAIKAVAKENGQYVAIPARSFNPVTVKVSTEVVVKLA